MKKLLLLSLFIAITISGCGLKRDRVVEPSRAELTPRQLEIVERLDLDADLIAQLEAKPLYEFTEQEVGAWLPFIAEDEPDLPARVREATGGAAIRLALDAVAGAATGRMAQCIAEEGTVCTYGAMSGQNAGIPIGEIVFRGVTFTGFMLGRFLGRRSPEKIRAIYAELAEGIANGTIHAPVDSVYALEDIRNALIRAQTGGRHGKVLVSPGGEVR